MECAYSQQEHEVHAGAPRPPGYLLVADYALVMLRRWPYVLVGMLVALGAAALVYIYADRIYESKCRLLVERTGSPSWEVNQLNRESGDWLATEVNLITSAVVLEQASEELGRRFSPSDLARRLHVERVRDTSILVLSFQARDPQVAKLAVESIAEAYSGHFRSRTRSFASKRLGEMQNQVVPRLQDRVRDAEKKRIQKQKEMGFFSLESPLDVANHRIKALSQKITELQIRRAEVQGRLDSLRRFAGEDLSKSMAARFSQSGSLAELTRHYRSLAEDLAARQHTLGPNHPQVEATKARMKAAEQEIREALRMQEETLKSDLATIDCSISNMQNLLDQARADAGKAVAMNMELEEYRREEQHAREMLEPNLKRLGELAYSQDFQTGWVEVVDPAVVPGNPLWPSRLRLALGGLLLGLLLGAGLAFLRESLDDTTKIAEDALHIWRLPVLGLVPHLENPPTLREHEEIARSSASDVEALRMLALSVDSVVGAEDEGNTGKVLVFSSAGAREGKTMLSILVGAMLAQGKERVLLVDADLRRRGLSKRTETSSRPGINSWFRHQDDISNYIEKGPIPTLDILPSGRWQEGPALLFRRELLRKLLEDLRSDYDYIIVDVPPMSFVSDALTLAGSSTRMVVVARMGMTSKRLLRRSKDLAETTGINVTGMVINDFDVGGAYYGVYHRYYGYYYPYKGYEYQYAPDTDPAAGEARKA